MSSARHWLEQDISKLSTAITEQAARIKALEDTLRVSKSTLNLVRNEGYNLPGSSIVYALREINELIGE